MGRERLAVGHGRAAACERSASRVRTPVASLPRPPQRAGMERHRRGLALAARGRHRAQRTGRVGDDGVVRRRGRYRGCLRRAGQPCEPASGAVPRTMGQHDHRARSDCHEGTGEAVSVRARAHAERRDRGDRFRAPSGVFAEVVRQRARHGGRTRGAGARPRGFGVRFPRIAGAVEDAGRRSGLRRGRRRGRPPGGGSSARPERLGRRAAGARVARGVRMAWMAPPRRAAARRGTAGGRLRRVGESERRTDQPPRRAARTARTRTRSTTSSGCNSTRPHGTPRNSCRCSGTWRPIEARSRRRAGCSCSGTGASPRIQRRQRSTCSGRASCCGSWPSRAWRRTCATTMWRGPACRSRR